MKINKKLILLSTLSVVIFSTASVANIVATTAVESSWKSKLSTNESKTECKGNACFAFISKPKSQTVEKEKEPTLILTETDVSVGDETITPEEEPYFACNSNIEYDYTESPFIGDYEDITEEYLTDTEIVAMDTISVQVGAFRNFSGAQKYAHRYSLMSPQYSVSIEESFKKEKFLYRVHVNGFVSNVEANKFINRYGSTGAFLVRK